jgi:hypothetical protein
MIERTGTHDWGSHQVFGEQLTINISFDEEGNIVFTGGFRTTVVKHSTKGELIAQTRGPFIDLRHLPKDAEVEVNGKTFVLDEIIEAHKAFYEKCYELQLSAEEQEGLEIEE